MLPKAGKGRIGGISTRPFFLLFQNQEGGFSSGAWERKEEERGTADDNTAAEAEADEASPPSAPLRFLRAAAVEAETGEAGS